MTWLKENYDYDVIAVCCNAGQKEDFDAIEKKALATGAIKAITIDLREEFITDYIWPTPVSYTHLATIRGLISVKLLRTFLRSLA